MDDCFVTEDIWFHDKFGMPIKRLKSDAVPMIFARSDAYCTFTFS